MQQSLQQSALPPLRHLATRSLRRPMELAIWASEERCLAPAVVSDAPGAIFHPDEWTRVRGVEPHTTLERERERILGGHTTHAATLLYRLEQALLSAGRLYVGGARLSVGRNERKALLGKAFWRNAVPVPEGMLCGSPFASQYFGHWMTEQLTAELLAERLGLRAYRPAGEEAYGHATAIRHSTDLRADEAHGHLFEVLWLAQDYGQNASKRARYLELRARLRANARAESTRGVFIMRGRAGGQRELQNEPEIAGLLRKRGFAVVNPETDSYEVLRDSLHAAPVAIGVEGSALIHAIMLMPEHSCLLAIQPPQRFNNVHKDYTDCLGQRYAFTVADPAAAGFVLPAARLERTLDLAGV